MSALLADAMIASGLKVSALAPFGHPIAALRDVQLHHFSILSAQATLARVIDAERPDLIVPGDDSAVTLLHLHLTHSGDDPKARERIALITRSLGDPAHFDAIERKSLFVAFAAAHGLPTPKSRVIQAISDFDALPDDEAWPMVLKADGWASGRGTLVVKNADEARQAYTALKRFGSLTGMIRDAMHQEMLLPLFRRALNGDQTVVLQAFVHGRPVNRAVVCHQGEVLAGRTVEAIENMPRNGNATVVRTRDLPKLDAVVERCVALLGLSGVAGFDFMHDETNGDLHLLELNPRATSACYVAPSGRPPLIQALAEHLAGAPITPIPAEVSGPIALFPQELQRDPDSPYLREGIADYQPPLHRPELVAACIRSARHKALIKRVRDALKGSPD